MSQPCMDLSEQAQSKFMVKSKEKATGGDQAARYVEDNAENKNPNLLRDPRLMMLEDENRFLKEELKREQAKARFYRLKFR